MNVRRYLKRSSAAAIAVALALPLIGAAQTIVPLTPDASNTSDTVRIETDISLPSADASSIVPIVALGTTQPIFDDVTAGAAHACALTSSGEAWCWGANNVGQLGAGDRTDHAMGPRPVAGHHRYVAIAAGAMHTCAITTDGTPECWGFDASGELGGGTSSPDCVIGPCSVVPRPVASTTRFDAIVAGHQHTCAIASGRLWCWGLNERGQLGVASTGERCGERRCSRTPQLVAGLTDVVTATAGGSHTCAVTSKSSGGASSTWCWGDNTRGQLGIGQPLSLETDAPTRVASDRQFRRLTSGAFHTCGLDDSGLVACWGDGSAGQLGADMATRSDVPLGESAGLRWRAVSASARTTCGVTDAGASYCWGYGAGGRLAAEPPYVCDAGPCARQPVRVAAIGTEPRSLVVGGTFACALGDDTIECWGDGMPPFDDQLEGALSAPQVDVFRSRITHDLPVRVNAGRGRDPLECRAGPATSDRPPGGLR